MDTENKRITYKGIHSFTEGICNCKICKSNDKEESMISMTRDQYMSLFNKDENLKRIASLETENSYLKELLNTNNIIMQRYKEAIQTTREDNNKLANQIAELTAQLDLYKNKKEN